MVNSTLEGWTSYNCGNGHSVTFTNCKFGKSNSGYAYLRPYNNTRIENCEFISEFRVNPNTNAITVNVNNSTWTGGTAVDATLIDWDGSHANAMVYINGVAKNGGEDGEPMTYVFNLTAKYVDNNPYVDQQPADEAAAEQTTEQ